MSCGSCKDCGCVNSCDGGVTPWVEWDFDGPIFHTSSQKMVVLTYWDRFCLWIGATDVESLDEKYRV